MNKKMLNLLTAYSAFTGSCMNSMYHPSIISNSIKFEKTNIKGLSSEEIGTKGNKKLSRSKRKRVKKKRKKPQNLSEKFLGGLVVKDLALPTVVAQV